jgi:hypothetical protein
VYTVNVSSIQDFMQCRFRWWCKWVMNRVPRKESPALAAGKLLHTIFEEHFQQGTSLAYAAELQLAEFKKAVALLPATAQVSGEEAATVIENMREAFPLWKPKFQFTEMLECEKPFALVLPQWSPNIRWLGRPDFMGICLGRIWHRQNRGLAAGMNFGTYTALAKRHYHEHLYAEYAVDQYKHRKLRYGGTIWNLIRKLKFRTNVGKKNEATKTADEMFFEHAMSIDLKGPLHKAVMMAMVQHVEEMQRVISDWESERIIPPPNEKLNGGFAGNALDPYYRVLVGEINLSDDEFFMDREDTYAPEATGE